jgi:hypothetical protein
MELFMLEEVLRRILAAVIGLNVFVFGLLMVFLINFRIYIARRAAARKFATLMFTAIQKSHTTAEVARQMELKVDEVVEYCSARSLETPEERAVRVESAQKRKTAELERIQQEEAAWRAEQDRISAERMKEKEAEMKERRERLKRFGIV